jgi:hypothetical protein
MIVRKTDGEDALDHRMDLIGDLDGAGTISSMSIFSAAVLLRCDLRMTCAWYLPKRAFSASEGISHKGIGAQHRTCPAVTQAVTRGRSNEAGPRPGRQSYATGSGAGPNGQAAAINSTLTKCQAYDRALGRSRVYVIGERSRFSPAVCPGWVSRDEPDAGQ